MESDLGKLFLGGISWDTDEERLKQYFRKYGEVVEAVIMRDRTTGRARGFGFVVFADPAVAERVLMDKHMLDGRAVEAKKAVPIDDQHSSNRISAGVHSSPGQRRTKKIFVGGLPSTTTEGDFKNYFDQFGTITDVVVMYDHNTQRQRGFGFITYNCEEAVDRVLYKTFHELNGKMIEVKRAVPKEHSPGSSRSRSPLIGYNYGLNRESNYFGNYAQGYNMSPVGGYGVMMDSRFNSLTSGISNFSPFGTSGHGMGVNLETGLNPSYNGASNLGSNLGYGGMYSPFNRGNSGRHTTPMGYNGGNRRSDPLLNNSWNVWGNAGFNGNHGSSTFLRSGSEPYEFSISNTGLNWGPFLPVQGGTNASSHGSGNSIYGTGDGNFSLGGGEFGRNSATGASVNSTFSPTGSYEGSYRDLYCSKFGYSDSTWGSNAPELDGSGSFGSGLGGIASDAHTKSSEGFTGNYNVDS